MAKIIDIIAPSGKVNPEVLPRIVKSLAEMGFTARIPKNLLGEDLLFANADAVRLELLQQALFAQDSDIVWAVRGGSGATRLLPGLKDLKPPKQKKRLLGFSDITALHLFLTQAWGWETVHAASARQVALPNELTPESLALTKALLLDPNRALSYPLTPLNQAADAVQVQAILTGGNLKLVESSLGTFWQIQSAGKILMLEDINELAYRVDRSLVHLRQAGVFDHIKAVVFGDFTFEKNAAEAAQNDKVLTRFAEELAVPVFRSRFFGHGKANSPWIYRKAEINGNMLLQ